MANDYYKDIDLQLLLIRSFRFLAGSSGYQNPPSEHSQNKGDFCLIGPLEITLTHALYHPFPSRSLLARIE